MTLKGKTALVTGSTSGIGLGIALSLAEAGADLLLNGFGEVDAALAQVRARGVRAEHHPADLSSPEQIGELMAFAERTFGGADILVNNAGIQYVAPVQEFPTERWDAIIAINLSSVFHTTRLALPGMLARGWGRIVNLSSIAGKVGLPDLAHYCASKFAVIGFSNALAKEVARDGVTVNALCPGIVGTGMWRGEDGLSGRWRQAGESEAQSWERHQASLLPQGEAQTVEDMGQLVVYLACAPHVTGQAIAVDGGFSL
ncbi:SDR family NAD(P)-dependent oxidoreductase [Pseudomonas aeruginosa]|uniref:SDR family NAD(P)-dependent oxidoreductase n=1 Tax=Pseudomonas aeruginosa TaxID=287 RepID=UPI000651D819|nr:SDR family NAD(P)-dependent oxidoreductase [Pseudomonas aeruginosa]